MPFYIPINARTEENGDHSRNAAGVEVLTLAPDNIVPAFTELELFWDFEGHPAANREPFRPIPWKRDPFELEDVLVRLDASGPRPVVFNPVVDPAGMWTSLLPPMPIEHYRRLLAEVGPALDELVVVNIAIYGSRSQEPQDLQIGVSKLFPWLTKAISYARAHIEKRKPTMPPRVKSSQIRQRIRKLRSPERMQTYRVMMLEAALALLLTRITKDLGARGTVLGVGSREPSARAPPQVRARPRRRHAAAS